jgi:hypothetical protein
VRAGDFRIIIDIKDVTEGDVETVAQDIWDRHAHDLDAKLGDFGVRVMHVQSGAQFDVDWTPAE